MLWKWTKNIYYSFPVQLLVLFLSNNLLLAITWIILIFLITGKIANNLGIKYLFLTPEYLGEVNFISYFLVGMGFGSFLMTWNLTTYLLESHRFPFLASLSRPFTKFCLNNSLAPLLFTGALLGYSLYFQLYYELWSVGRVLFNLFGFICGTFFLIFVSVLYFQLTNKDILTFLNITKKESQKNSLDAPPDEKRPDWDSLYFGSQKPHVTTYLNESLRPRLVRSVAHYDSKILMRVFKQNHLNALFAQSLSIVVLILLGYMIDNQYFMIPAGASIFLISSVAVAIIGSISYWFHKWRLLAMVMLLITLNFLTRNDLLNYKNQAYGLNYEKPQMTYEYESIASVCSPENVENDKKETELILNNWKHKVSKVENEKPTFVIISVTGGGLRAANWAMQVVQKTDSILNGDLMKHTALISGSSGGIIGISYLRELYHQNLLGQEVNYWDDHYIDKISNDLLNAIAFTIVSNDLFVPWSKFETGGYKYKKDRGYVFEKQLSLNTDHILDMPLKAYKEPEQSALIPMLFITPSVINDGRRLVISPQRVSYMMIAPIGVENPNTVEADALDFGRFFENHDAYNLRFTTALRMNATYPYVLPNVYLPTENGLAVMDAGYRDNYGLLSATRFIHVFKDWIKTNAGKVVLIQIRGRDKFSDKTKSNQGVIETILNPIGVAGQITELQEFEHDANIGYIFDLLGKDKFEIIRFTYTPTKDHERASITFHLTEREKKDIREAFLLENNQESLKRLKNIFN